MSCTDGRVKIGFVFVFVLHLYVGDVDGIVHGPDAAATVVKDADAMETAGITGDTVATLVASAAKQLRPDRQRAAQLRRIFL